MKGQELPQQLVCLSSALAFKQQNAESHSAKNIERSGTPADNRISIICASNQAVKKYFQTACKAEKSSRTFAARFNRKRPNLKSQKKNLKNFR
ncbi:hypothetical protein [Hymenobacter terrenus]|uniref:hypothetical protein n=1 Tax=Hymenobacter terrenus TaxID=1629124 RepID=UPI0012E0A539|nr:hypothetical protein [Hymenobacter terrenus]